jgi:hypothetical protein
MPYDTVRGKELAVLYAELAKNLVAWKVGHEGKIEDPTQLPPDEQLPVVWQVHQKLTEGLPDMPRPHTGPEVEKYLRGVSNAVLEGVLASVNRVLADNAQALGGTVHTLRTGEMLRLIVLMRVTDNLDLAPYWAPPETRGW